MRPLNQIGLILITMNNSEDTISRSWLITQVKKHKSKLLFANIIAIFATLISVPIPLLMPLMVD